MAVLTIIYNDGAEQHRWLHNSVTHPSPWNQPVGSYLMQQINTVNIWWYTRKSADYGWQPVEIDDVPKVYRLLFLLE